MKRILILILRMARASLLAVVLPAVVSAGNVYPFRIISGTTTGEVDETQFSTNDISLSLTNLPGGGRRAIIGIIGGGGGGGGTTNVLDSAGGSYDLVGHTNQPTLLIKGLTNQSPSILTITDFGTMLGLSSSASSGGATNTWFTNGVLWATSDAFSFSNASSVVGLAFTNLGGVPTIYLVPDSTIARTGQSQTWTAPQTFNSSATLTLGGSVWANGAVTISNTATVTGDATIGGNATITGNVTSGGTSSFAHFGAGQIDSGTIDSNRFPSTAITPNSYGDSSHAVTIGVGSDGRIYAVQQVAFGNLLGSATNAITGVFADGASNSPVTFLSFQNFTVHTLNGTTSTVGFANIPFDSITVPNGTTNYTLHGSSLTFSNLLSPYGVTLTNRGNAQIDLGGTVTMLSNGAGAYLAMSGSSASPTVTVAATASTLIPIITTPNASGYKFAFNGTANGVNPTAQFVIQDGSNFQSLQFNRDGAKDNTAQGVYFIDSNAGKVSFYQSTDTTGISRKRHAEIETSTSVGGLLIVSQDGGMHDVGYQFYENDPRFPRILFTNNKAQIDTNSPALHETYASFGNWTNQFGKLEGGAAIITGSNENWLVACGRALGSVSGVKDKEYPTNRFSGFLAGSLDSAQSNQTFMVVRDQTNGLWCIGVDTNGVLGAYRTNDLSTTVLTY